MHKIYGKSNKNNMKENLKKIKADLIQVYIFFFFEFFIYFFYKKIAIEDKMKDMKNMINFLSENFSKRFFEKRDDIYNLEKKNFKEVDKLELKLNRKHEDVKRTY